MSVHAAWARETLLALVERIDDFLPAPTVEGGYLLDIVDLIGVQERELQELRGEVGDGRPTTNDPTRPGSRHEEGIRKRAEFLYPAHLYPENEDGRQTLIQGYVTGFRDAERKCGNTDPRDQEVPDVTGPTKW